MYAALFETKSWMGEKKHIVKGKDVAGLIDDFEEVQSLGCLVRMGRGQEGPEGQKQLNKLEDILDKRDNGTITVEELLELDIDLSVGKIKCSVVIEGDDAIEQLKAQYPDARCPW